MEFYMEASARNYIRKNNADKAITVGIGKREGAHCGCCVPGGTFPTVKLGVSPFDKDTYNKINIDGIDIYYPVAVSDTFKTVTVKVEGFLFLKQLLALAS